VLSDRDVADTLKSMDCEVREYDAPGLSAEIGMQTDLAQDMTGKQSGSAQSSETDAEYASGLLRVIEEFQPDAVLALQYFPTVSIVCQAAGVKYAAWICLPYDPGVYSCTMLNSCNYVFFADRFLCQTFSGGEFSHVFYLPLGANAERIQRLSDSADLSEEDRPDLVMMQDIYPRENMYYNPLSADSPLKDATKGYLEGCIACQHQIYGLPSMAEHLPAYVWEDLTAYFLPKVGGDSIETAAQYYDHLYFNPLITNSDRDVHLGMVAGIDHFKKTVLYNGCESNKSEKVECRGRADYLTEVPIVARQGKINFVITNRNFRSAVPQIAWDIMAAGGFLVSNFQGDYLELFPERRPVLFENKKDMLSKSIYQLHHETEREALAKELMQTVRENHSIRRRIEKLLKHLC
jgi:spore maturation protein CgeB